jgi:hypothetical protein
VIKLTPVKNSGGYFEDGHTHESKRSETGTDIRFTDRGQNQPAGSVEHLKLDGNLS